jgi:hypothetical protein
MLVAKQKHYGPHFADADPEMTVAVDDAAPTRGTFTGSRFPGRTSCDTHGVRSGRISVIRTELDQVESEHQHQRLLGQRVGHHIGLFDASAFFDLKLGKDTRTFTACP